MEASCLSTHQSYPNTRRREHDRVEALDVCAIALIQVCQTIIIALGISLVKLESHNRQKDVSTDSILHIHVAVIIHGAEEWKWVTSLAEEAVHSLSLT